MYNRRHFRAVSFTLTVSLVRAAVLSSSDWTSEKHSGWRDTRPELLLRLYPTILRFLSRDATQSAVMPRRIDGRTDNLPWHNRFVRLWRWGTMNTDTLHHAILRGQFHGEWLVYTWVFAVCGLLDHESTPKGTPLNFSRDRSGYGKQWLSVYELRYIER